MASSCGNVSQIMTRYLRNIINSRSSWNSVVFVHDQGREELDFWRGNLRVLNGVPFWPVPFVPCKVLFSDASFDGLRRFYSRFQFSLSQKLVHRRVSKVFDLEGAFCN